MYTYIVKKKRFKKLAKNINFSPRKDFNGINFIFPVANIFVFSNP